MSSADYNILKDLYYNQNTGLQGSEKLWRKAKELHPDFRLTFEKVNDWVQNQTNSQIHHDRKVKKYFPITEDIQVPFQRLQSDLVDMQKFPVNANGGYRYIHLTIDCYSRYLIAIPIKFKNKSECLRALELLIQQVKAKNHGFPPQRIDSDLESSFRSRDYQKVLDENDIESHFVAVDDYKSLAFIDRSIRTLREMISQSMTLSKSNRWYSVLQNIVENYNNTYHRSIKMSPNQALKTPNQIQLSDYISEYRSKLSDQARKQKWYQNSIKVGDKVRTIIPYSIFDKRTGVKFSKQVFTVTSIESGIWFYLDNKVKKWRKYELLNAGSSNPISDADADIFDEMVEDQKQQEEKDNSSPDNDDPDANVELDEYRRTQQQKRRLNKEGLDLDDNPDLRRSQRSRKPSQKLIDQVAYNN